MTDQFSDDELCQVCQNDWAWHKAVKPMHEFIALGMNPSLRAAKPAAGSGDPPRRDPAVISQMLQQNTDPVLRALLVDKGIMKPEELTRMEQRMVTNLAASGAVVVQEGASRGGRDSGGGQPRGDRGDDHSDRDVPHTE